MTPVLVLTTVGASFDVTPFAHQLVTQRLAACVNVLDGIHSIYRWQGKVEEESEKLLLIKTVEERIDELREAVFASHPYEIPEFVVLPIAAIEGPYRQWLIGSVSPE